MHPRRGAQAVAAPLALLSALAATLVGCSDDSAPASSQPPASASTSPATASADTEPVARPALRLRTSTVRGTTCVQSGVRDFAWFEVQWRATEAVDDMRFHLAGAEHVRSVGSGLTVPPMNYGGRIDYSGATSWGGRAVLAKDRQISWLQRGPVWTWTPSRGETGLVVLHLRFDGEPATIDGVRARWTTADGRTGTTQVDVPERWRFARSC